MLTLTYPAIHKSNSTINTTPLTGNNTSHKKAPVHHVQSMPLSAPPSLLPFFSHSPSKSVFPSLLLSIQDEHTEYVIQLSTPLAHVRRKPYSHRWHTQKKSAYRESLPIMYRRCLHSRKIVPMLVPDTYARGTQAAISPVNQRHRRAVPGGAGKRTFSGVAASFGGKEDCSRAIMNGKSLSRRGRISTLRSSSSITCRNESIVDYSKERCVAAADRNHGEIGRLRPVDCVIFTPQSVSSAML